TAAFYKQVKLLYIAIFFFMGLVLSTVVILATANTMTMSVFERTREIGSLLGAIVSLLLRIGLNASGIMLPPPPGGTHGNLLHVDFIPLAYGLGFVMM